MDTQRLAPENFDERVVWVALTWTYVFYLLGALYVVAPVIAWLLILRRIAARFLIPEEAARAPLLPLPVAAWLIGMLVMLLALVVGHVEQELGIAKLIKSSIGWAKGWALIAVFIVLGCQHIRPELVVRACTVVCGQTLLLVPLFVLAWLLGLPQTPYVSPLKIIGGPGPEFFALSLYEIDPGSGLPRWRLFTPWAPALGFVANVFFLMALREPDRFWRWCGILGSIVMILMSQSRLALVSLAGVALATFFLARLAQPRVLMFGGFAATVAGLFGGWLVEAFERFWGAFRAARADSTRVREALGRIAIDRWQQEAPVWGHGIVERGPHLVEYMPIGSHHSWYGLLFVKGVVGFFALALPLFISFADLLVRAQAEPLARTALGIIIVLFLYTFGENLEILSYLYWPGLLLIGAAHAGVPLPRHEAGAAAVAEAVAD